MLRMSVDLTTQAVALQQVKAQTTAQYTILKKQNEMEKMAIDMVSAVAKSAPAPAGQGTRVDKYA